MIAKSQMYLNNFPLVEEYINKLYQWQNTDYSLREKKYFKCFLLSIPTTYGRWFFDPTCVSSSIIGDLLDNGNWNGYMEQPWDQLPYSVLPHASDLKASIRVGREPQNLLGKNFKDIVGDLCYYGLNNILLREYAEDDTRPLDEDVDLYLTLSKGPYIFKSEEALPPHEQSPFYLW